MDPNVSVIKDKEITEVNAKDIREELKRDPEVQELSKQVDVRNQMELLEFGKEPAVKVSQFSDRILSTMKSSSMTDSGTMLKQLGQLMDKFDKKDFEESKGVFGKLFKKRRKND